MTLRDDYNRDGYVVIRGEEMCPCQEDWKSKFDTLRLLLKLDIKKYVNRLGMESRLVSVQNRFLDSAIQDPLKCLGISVPVIIGTPILHVMSEELRIPGEAFYYGTTPHQDWPSTQGSLDCVTVWVALTDAGVGNFPLEVIPGSHKQGLREGKLHGSVLEIECDDREFVPLECKAGDVVIFSGFLVHRTGQGSGFRIAISQRFDNADEPTFIERGYPCAQRRVVDREIRWRPTQDQVRKIFK